MTHIEAKRKMAGERFHNVTAFHQLELSPVRNSENVMFTNVTFCSHETNSFTALAFQWSVACRLWEETGMRSILYVLLSITVFWGVSPAIAAESGLIVKESERSVKKSIDALAMALENFT